MDTSLISTKTSTETTTAPFRVQTILAQIVPSWLAKIGVGNPFYLISAALLLYGIYRVAVDPKFLSTESLQVIFNFSALQLYEALVALTAILLARRLIWADATLLVKLEALLVLAPFILVSHAVFLGENLGRMLCLTAAILAILRLAALRYGLPHLQLPKLFWAAGFLVLVLNTALPLIFRAGLDTDSEAWHTKHLLLWVAVLPGLMFLPNVFVRAPESKATPLDRRWLPFTVYLFWMLGTGVHLVCLNYVDQVNFRRQSALEPHLVAPVLWALAWTLFFRRAHLFPAAGLRGYHAFLVIPTLALLPALESANTVFLLVLAALNGVLYAVVYLRRRGQIFPLHLALFSFGAAIASVPPGAGWMLSTFGHGGWIAIGTILWVLAEGLLIRSPRFGLAGSVLLILAVFKLSAALSFAWPLAVQFGLVWLLFHSLRWDDRLEPKSALLRVLVSLGWTVHSWDWINQGDGASWVPWMALLVLAFYAAMRLFGGVRIQVIIPAAAAFAIGPIPMQSAGHAVQRAPAGVIALVSSFLLFGLGTAFALWRSSATGKTADS